MVCPTQISRDLPKFQRNTKGITTGNTQYTPTTVQLYSRYSEYCTGRSTQLPGTHCVCTPPARARGCWLTNGNAQRSPQTTVPADPTRHSRQPGGVGGACGGGGGGGHHGGAGSKVEVGGGVSNGLLLESTRRGGARRDVGGQRDGAPLAVCAIHALLLPYGGYGGRAEGDGGV